MNEPPTERYADIDLETLQRGALAALLVGLTTLSTFLAVHFGVTTVKDGVESSAREFVKRLELTFDRLYTPLTLLVTQADELGAAQLFERLPYPRLLKGYVQYPSHVIHRFELVGVHLDCLRHLKIEFFGAEEIEETTSGTVGLEGEEYVFKARRNLTDSTERGRALLRLTSLQNRTYSYQVPFELLTEGEEVPGGSRSPSAHASPQQVAAHPNATPSRTDPDPNRPAIGSSPGSAAVANDGSTELVDVLQKLPGLSQQKRESYIDQARQGTFADQTTRSLLADLTLGLSNLQDALLNAFRSILDLRYMRHRTVRGMPQPIHSFSVSDLDLVLGRMGPKKTLEVADKAGSIASGLALLLDEIQRAQVAVVPSAASIGSSTQGETKLDERFYREVYEKERSYQECMAILDVVQKAYATCSANAFMTPALDFQLLRQKGFLTYTPSCPQEVNGGHYELASKTRSIRCHLHGSRGSPWPENHLYQQHFAAFTRAKILFGKQGRLKDAIKELTAYLEKDKGREGQNLYAHAFLSQLLFHDKNYTEALKVTKKLSDHFTKSIRFAFQTATCFYAQNNESSALTYVKRTLTPSAQEFDRSLDEDSSLYELYQMQDQAGWMKENLDRRHPVRYAEFVLRGKPEFPSRLCYESLERMKQLLPRLVSEMRQETSLKSLWDRLVARETSISRLASYQSHEHLQEESDLFRLRGKLKDSVFDLLKRLRLGGQSTLRACPVRGIYTLGQDGSLRCNAHEGLLPPTRLEVTPPLVDWELTVLEVVLQYAQQTLSPDLTACLVRQRQLLGHFRLEESGRVSIPQDYVLDNLVKAGKVSSSMIRPGGSESYRVAQGSEEGILECSVHQSFQRLILQIPSLDLGPTADR